MSDTTGMRAAFGLAAQMYLMRPQSMDSDQPRIYLAGPMTGLPAMNYPAFHAEAARLRGLGYHVQNPAETPYQETWGDYMRHAIAKLVTCDRIAMLTGWEYSSGANKEHTIAGWLGMPCQMAYEITEPAEESADA